VRFPFHNKDGDPGTLYGGIVNQNWLVFRCPADTTANQLRDIPMTLPDGTTGYYAAGSYAANGMLPWGSGGLKDITRGTATTIMLGERPQVCRTAAGDTVYNLWGVGFYSPHMPAFAALTPIAPPGLWSTGQIAPVMPLPGEQAEDRNTAIHYRVGRKDAPPQAADFPTPIQPLRKDQPCDPRLPGSMHNAGMQVAMADGSVRTFAADTEPWVFWSACAPGGKR
jgi:prepilin-type processing-associated H-X9-DG protein